MTESKFFLVGKEHELKTLSDALKVANDYDIIQLEEETFSDYLPITKKVKIQAKEKCCATILIKDDDTFFINTAVSFQKIHFVQNANPYKYQFSSFNDREEKIENCDFSSIKIKDSHTVNFTSCHFEKFSKNNIFMENSKVQFVSCDFSENNYSCILAKDSQVILTKTSFSSNFNGSLIFGNSDANYKDCRFNQMRLSSIKIKDESSLRVTNSKFRYLANDSHINANDNTKLVLKNIDFNRIESEVPAIFLSGNSQTEIENVSMYWSFLLFAEKNASILCKNSKFIDIGAAETIFYLQTDGVQKIINCQFKRCNTTPIKSSGGKLFVEKCFCDESSGFVDPDLCVDSEISDCLIKDCGTPFGVTDVSHLVVKNTKIKIYSSIMADCQGFLELYNCELNNGKPHGIFAMGDSRVIVEGCKISECDKIGVAATEYSKIKMCNCQVSNCKWRKLAVKDFGEIIMDDQKFFDTKENRKLDYLKWLISVRAMDESMLDDYRKFYFEYFPNTDKENFDELLESNKYLLERGDMIDFLAFLDKKIVGSIQINAIDSPLGPSRVLVSNFQVLPGYRRMGIGTALMDAARNHAENFYNEKLELDSSNDEESFPAHEFYKNYGFECESSKYFKLR